MRYLLRWFAAVFVEPSADPNAPKPEGSTITPSSGEQLNVSLISDLLYVFSSRTSSSPTRSHRFRPVYHATWRLPCNVMALQRSKLQWRPCWIRTENRRCR